MFHMQMLRQHRSRHLRHFLRLRHRLLKYRLHHLELLCHHYHFRHRSLRMLEQMDRLVHMKIHRQ